MKIAKLLVLSALSLMGLNANAELVDGVRQKPVPVTQGFVASEDTTTAYYLYNVDAKGFFVQGNAWETQVSIGDNALRVAFTEVEDGVYLLNSFSSNRTTFEWRLTFFDNENGMFVDHASQANYGWGVEEHGETFRLFAANSEGYNPDFNWDYYPDMYVGLDVTENPNNTACSPFLMEEEGHYITWALVTLDNFAAWKALNDVYAKAQELLASITVAEEKNIDVAAQKAVYANEAATIEELEAATAAVKLAIQNEAENSASPENPQDMSSLIVNPTFDGNNLTNGWEGDAFGSAGPKENAEHYSKNYDTHQTITGMPNGVYAVGVKAFYRAGYSQDAYNNYKANNEASRNAKLYAISGETTVTAPIVSPCTAENAEMVGIGSESEVSDDETGDIFYIPNNMEAAEYYMHEMGKYDNKVLVAVGDGQLTIGVKKTTTIDGDWSLFDDFSLTYYGNTAAAYQLWIDEVKKGAVDYSDTPASASYIEAYNNALSNASGSTFEEALAAINAINAASEAIANNIAAWDKWEKKVAEAQVMALDDSYSLSCIGDLSDYVDAEVGDIRNAKSLTNEQLDAEIAKIDQMMAEAKDCAKNSINPGDDVTRFLNNPGFEFGLLNASDPNGFDGSYGTAEGWTVERNADGNLTGGPLGDANDKKMMDALGYTNHCFESWHCHNFDVWQEVSGVPFGVYEIQVQGYVRCEMPGYVKGDVENCPESPIYLYMNSAKSRFPNVYSENLPEDKEFTIVEDWTVETVNDLPYPNSMGGAAQCFSWDMYKMKAYGLVAKEGDVMRIGVKGVMDTDWWCIWDNFKLTYKGFQPDVVKPALEDALATINLDQDMGKSIYGDAEKVNAAAADAIAANDGTAMFNALTSVYDLTENILASVAKFKELRLANESLPEAVSMSENDAAKGEVNALYDEIESNLRSHNYEDEDIPALLAKINAAKCKLRIPANYASATDASPVDMTVVIENPDFIDNANGWSGDGAAHNIEAGNAEFYNKNFDFYQEFAGMPAGVYEFGVQAYYRAGYASNDYDNLAEDSLNKAFIYADANGASFSAPLIRLGAQAQEGEPYDGYVAVGEGYFVPNTMATGGEVFALEDDLGNYFYAGNKVVLKVGEDGYLRIGLKKATTIEGDWTLFDNFTLFYYGPESTKELSGDPAGIDDLQAVPATKVEYFTLDGRRVNRLQKGIVVMKQTLANGAVVVKKIRK